MNNETLNFRGGPLMSIIPIGTFLIGTIILVILKAPTIEGMVVCAMAGISAGMLVSKDTKQYNEAVFSLMSNRIATVAIVCWLWAGMFSGILAGSGLVEAIVWVGWKLDLTSSLFTVVVFVCAALFAVSIGTGLGTIVGFTAVFFPAGIVLGAHPAALIGAIFSGAAIGDNLAPVSDTTIISAATQETDVGGVVRSRLKYVLPMAGISILLFVIFGGSDVPMDNDRADTLLKSIGDPKGLPMLIPAVLVFVMAMSGKHFLSAITVGIVSAMIIGPAFGIMEFSEIINFKNNTVGGSAVSGAISLIPISILTLLLVTAIGIMQSGGLLDKLLMWLQNRVAKSEKATEFSILGLITFTNLCVSANAVAMIAAGPLTNKLRKKFNISPYRAANLMDTVSCSFPFLLPYASSVAAALAIQGEVAEHYDFVQVIPASEFVPFCFYSLLLFPFMVIAVWTGYGKTKASYKAAQNNDVKN